MEEVSLNAGEGTRIRSWRSDDASDLARLANDRGVWINLRDAFPHPYTLADAHTWIASCLSGQSHQKGFAIEHMGEPAGGIGVLLQTDVHRVAAEIGYWLGRPYWNRGIMTRVIRVFSSWAMTTYALERLHCGIYEWNIASSRVLEKCGYVKEGIAKRAAIKDGRIIDVLLYALTEKQQKSVQERIGVE